MANFLQPFLGNRPKIDDNKYTNIRQPWSRPKTKPIKRAQPLPSGPDEDEVDFLIYTKKAKLSSLDEQYKQYGHIGDAYEHCGPYENWTGSQWDPQPPDPRRIRGNGDAATLLNEFNETIDYARDLDRYINDVETSHGSLPKRLTDTFGPDTFSSMSHKELVDAIVPLVQLLFKERFRAFNAGINDDHSMRWRSTNDHEIAKAQRNVISRRIHRPRLEKDILLIRATSVPYPGNDFRRHMREYYEGIFKLRVGEASNIIRKAMETDSTLPTLSDDKRTHEAKRYTWIIRVINHYIGWRLGVTFNLKRALREPGEAREHLSRLDRMTWTDSYYEAFLDASMALLNDMQALGAWQAATSRLWAAMKTHAIGAGSTKVNNMTRAAIRECTDVLMNVLEEDFLNSDPITTVPLAQLPRGMPYTHPRVRVENFQIVERTQFPLYRFDGYVNDNGFKYQPNPGQWTQVQPGTAELWPTGLPKYTVPSAAHI